MDFDPDKKKNQHYVPQFWQKKFSFENSQLVGLRGNKIENPVSPRKEMASDWIYTTFDRCWNPSNYLEDLASNFESKAAKAFASIESPGSAGTQEEEIYIIWFIAFSACRHPDIINSGHRRSKELASNIGSVYTKDITRYCRDLQNFGIHLNEAAILYNHLRKLPQPQIDQELLEIERLSPNDYQLPAQIAIDSETIERVFFGLSNHQVTILDAPERCYFILGDTPFPETLKGDFVVPISHSLALNFNSNSGNPEEQFSPFKRRTATAEEVLSSNKNQYNQALNLVIGPTEESLTATISS